MFVDMKTFTCISVEMVHKLYVCSFMGIYNGPYSEDRNMS